MSAASLFAASKLQLNQETVALVERAVSASTELLSPKSQATFEQVLTDLAHKVGSEAAEQSRTVEGDDFQGKLVQIALNCVQYPEVYEDLRKRYIGLAREIPEPPQHSGEEVPIGKTVNLRQNYLQSMLPPHAVSHGNSTF